MRGALRLLALLSLAHALAPAAMAAPAALPRFNADISQTSVSGLSSGAYMAVQFEVAYSSVIKGAGVIAGGPYLCAQGSVVTATTVCTCTAFAPFCRNTPGATQVASLVEATEDLARRGAIDATRHLKGHRVFLFSGKLDTKVPTPVAQDLASFYGHFMPAAQVRLVTSVNAGHAMPTESFGNPCETSSTPFINRCRFDGAGELLAWIHGRLNPKRAGPLAGRLLEFDQSEFLPDPARHGLDATGWLFVPRSCELGAACRIHVAFHGCHQGQGFTPSVLPFVPTGAPFGKTFIEHAGYNEWADTNDLIVLYPQATSTLANPQGCWDWWGYDGPDYATKASRQVAAVKAMVDRIAGNRR